MRFATLYKESTGYVDGTIPPKFDGPKKPIPALGSDGVYIFDGRYSLEHCLDIAREVCRKRKMIGFTIEEGKSFTQSKVIRNLERVMS